MRPARHATHAFVIGALVLVPLLPVSRAQESDGGDRAAKAGRLVDHLGLVDATSSLLRQAWLRRGWSEEKVADAESKSDWGPMRDAWVKELSAPGVLSDDDLAASLALLDGLKPEQRAALARMENAVRHVDLVVEHADWGDFYRETEGRMEGVLLGVSTATNGGKPRPVPPKAVPTDTSYRTNVVNLMRALAGEQGRFRAGKHLDLDGDGTGEYGLLRELMGQVPLRAGADGTLLGDRIPGQPLLWGWHAPLGEGGTMSRDGYLVRVYLPDDGKEGGHVHESGPMRRPTLSGGTGRVSTDAAETRWCAYAWPEERGTTGSVVLMIDESGRLLRSANTVALWSGLDRAPDALAAYRGTGADRTPAEGATGNDGDAWVVE